MMKASNGYKQVGWNDSFPEIVQTWCYGDPVPEWLSDRAKVKFIDASGNITLDYRETSAGGIEVIDTSGQGSLAILGSRSDILCYGGGSRIFPLRPVQFELLYGPLSD